MVYKRKKRSTRPRQKRKISKVDTKIFLYYIGNADVYKYCSIRDGKIYKWVRPNRSSPGIASVDEKDAKDILELRGKGCSLRKPDRLFLTETEYSKEFGV